jgi:hypothetical protein
MTKGIKELMKSSRAISHVGWSKITDVSGGTISAPIIRL